MWWAFHSKIEKLPTSSQKIELHATYSEALNVWWTTGDIKLSVLQNDNAKLMIYSATVLDASLPSRLGRSFRFVYLGTFGAPSADHEVEIIVFLSWWVGFGLSSLLPANHQSKMRIINATDYSSASATTSFTHFVTVNHTHADDATTMVWW